MYLDISTFCHYLCFLQPVQIQQLQQNLSKLWLKYKIFQNVSLFFQQRIVLLFTKKVQYLECGLGLDVV